MSASERDDRLLRDDPALAADLRAAFAAYSQIAPAREGRAALLERIERADPGAPLVADGPLLRRRKLWWLSVIVLAGSSLLAALTWRHGASVAPNPSQLAGTPEGESQTMATTVRAEPLAQPAVASTVSEAVEPAREATPLVPVSGSEENLLTGDAARVREQGAARSPRAGAADPAQELALLMRAKRVLPNDAEAALALTREHERRFRRGSFVEEREVIAIEALVRSGKVAVAQQRAELFRAAHPRSPHVDRLSVVLREP